MPLNPDPLYIPGDDDDPEPRGWTHIRQLYFLGAMVVLGVLLAFALVLRWWPR